MYTTIVSKFEEWSNDAHSVVKDQPLICEGWSLSDADEIFTSLFDKADKDDDLHELLQLLFKSFAIIYNSATGGRSLARWSVS